MIWEIFIAGGFFYGCFLLWHFNWRGPMQADEIANMLEILKSNDINKHSDLTVLHEFMLSDTGKDFCMANFVELAASDVKDPVTGELLAPRKAVEKYTKGILPIMLKHGCYPVYQALKVGGHIDSWGSDDKFEFPAIAMMRWRSRRDFMNIVTDPAFSAAISFKYQSITRTISVPTEFKFSTFFRPHIWMPLVILQICCLLQIIFSLV